MQGCLRSLAGRRPAEVRERGPARPVLLVEHYLPLARAVQRGLEEEGIVTHLATNNAEADARLRNAPYAAAVVGWNIPRGGGPALVRGWRDEGLQVPVLMLIPSVNGSTLFRAVEAGMVSVTPLHLDLTNYRLMERIRSWDLKV